MKNRHGPTIARHAYAAAYDAHYTGHDLPLALQLYRNLIVIHPNAQEADYSRTQIQNIVNVVVPKQVLLDAQVELVNAHCQSAPADDVQRISVAD